MRAKKVMTVGVTTISPGATVQAARRCMLELGVRHLPVVEGGRLVGMMSDRDVIRHGAAPRRKVAAVMARHPYALPRWSTVNELAHLMVDEKIDAVPITGPRGRLLGLVTSSDLMQLLTDVMPKTAPLPFSFELRHAED